jgi:hypothetical protein
MWESCSYGSERVQAGNCLFLLDNIEVKRRSTNMIEGVYYYFDFPSQSGLHSISKGVVIPFFKGRVIVLRTSIISPFLSLGIVTPPLPFLIVRIIFRV